MNVGIFGGSFNPIHKGHTGLAQDICRTGVADELWFMVSPLNPLKSEQQNDLLPTEVRLHLAQLATADSPQLHVCDLETRLSLPSYTVRTLEVLTELYPQHDFALVVGEDNWQHFDRWYRADDIRARHDIIVYGRDAACGIVIHRTDGTIQTFPQPRLYDISSTQIRTAVREGRREVARQWLHPDVFDYVISHSLFTSQVL